MTLDLTDTTINEGGTPVVNADDDGPALAELNIEDEDELSVGMTITIDGDDLDENEDDYTLIHQPSDSIIKSTSVEEVGS